MGILIIEERESERKWRRKKRRGSINGGEGGRGRDGGRGRGSKEESNRDRSV